MSQALRESIEFLQKKIGDFKPEVGIVLGTGLGGLVNEIEVLHSIMYAAIPNFPISTFSRYEPTLSKEFNC